MWNALMQKWCATVVILVACAVFSSHTACAAQPKLVPYSYPGDDNRSHFIGDVACVDGTVYLLDVVADPTPEDPAKFQRVRDLILVRIEASGQRREYFIGKVERPSALINVAMRAFPKPDGPVFVLAQLVDGRYDVFRVEADGSVGQLTTFKEEAIFDAVASDDLSQIVAVTAGTKASLLYRIDTVSGRVEAAKVDNGKAMGGYTAAFLSSNSGDLFAAGVVMSPSGPETKVIVNRVGTDNHLKASVTFAGSDPVKIIPGSDGDSVVVLHASPAPELRIMVKVLSSDSLKTRENIQLPLRSDILNKMGVASASQDGFWLMIADRAAGAKDHFSLIRYSRGGKELASWSVPAPAFQYVPVLCRSEGSLYVALSGKDPLEARSPRWRAQVFTLTE